VRPLLREHWRRLTEELVPLLETLIEADAARPGGDTSHRLRLGLYGFDTPSAAREEPAVTPRKRSRRSLP
jgi:hypothetical protein